MSPVFLSWFTTVRGKTKESRTRPRATPFLSTRKFAYVCHNTLAHRQTHKTHLHFPSRCRIMLTIRGMLRVHTDKALRISCLCFFLLFFSFSSTPNLNTLSLIRLQEARSHSSSSSRSGQHDELPGPTKGMQLHYMHFTIFDLLLERVPALYVIFLFSSLFLSIHPLQPHPPPYFLLCSCNSCALGTLSKTEKKREGGWHPCRYYMDRNTYFVLKKSRRFIPTGWFHCFGSSQTRSTDTFQCMFDVFFLLWEGGGAKQKE